MVQKYTLQERNKILTRIGELNRQNLSWPEIAEQMNAEGFKRPSGKPHSPLSLNALAVRNGIRKHRKYRHANRKKVTRTARKKFPTVAKGPSAPDTVLAILTDPKLGESKKLRLLTAYYE